MLRQVVTIAPRRNISRATTHAADGADGWLHALDTHKRNLGTHDGTPPCLQSEVDCDGTIVLVETCCYVGELPEDCVRRHTQAVQHACDH